MYEDLYTNHYLNMRCSRVTFLAFVAYTLTALEGSSTPALKALAAPLRAHYSVLSGAVVGRQQQAGSGKGLTRSRRELMTLMREFVRNLNAELLVPKYRRTPEVLDVLLPGGLTAFTRADNDALPVLFEAFTKELETDLRANDLTTQPGKDARLLVNELVEATRLKDAGTKQKRETIGTIGGQWTVLCQDLWQAHCLALGQFWATPEQARTYFNYALIPQRNPQRQDDTAATSATPATPTE
jgi:hypothetical protein